MKKISILFGFVILLGLSGCDTGVPEVYKSASGKCSYGDIKGKEYKYTGEYQYMDIIFLHNPNIEAYQQMGNEVYAPLMKGFKILKTGITTAENRAYNESPILSDLRYNKGSIDNNDIYILDGGVSTKIISKECQIFYTQIKSVSEFEDSLSNIDGTELSINDITNIAGSKNFRKSDFKATIKYDRFEKTHKIHTPELYSSFIRGAVKDKTVLYVQLYTSLYFKNKWGFIDKAIDTDGKKHTVVKISTDTDCSQVNNCSLTETIGIALSIDFLEKYKKGFEIKAYGTKEKVIKIPGAMVRSFLSGINKAKITPPVSESPLL